MSTAETEELLKRITKTGEEIKTLKLTGKQNDDDEVSKLVKELKELKGLKELKELKEWKEWKECQEWKALKEWKD